MNLHYPVRALEPGFPEQPSNQVAKLNPPRKCFKHVRNTSLRSLVLIEKVHSFRREKGNRIGPLVLMMVLSGMVATAQNAGNWNFNGSVNGTAGAFNTVSAASLGPGITLSNFNGGTEFYGEGTWPTGSLDPDYYLQFGLTPPSSGSLNLSSVTLVIRRSTTGTPSGSGPTQWELRSSKDNYVSSLANGVLTTSYATFTISLPAAFQSLSSTVSFRLYGYHSSTSPGGNSRFVYDNISVQGQGLSSLPVRFTSVNAEAEKEGTAVLKWGVEEVSAGTVFRVERSVDGVSFTAITWAQTEISHAASVELQYTDEEVPSSEQVCYRILAKEPGGAEYRSSVVVIRPVAHAGMHIKGILVQGSSVMAYLQVDQEGDYLLSVQSLNGTVLFRKLVRGLSFSAPVADISSGNYHHGAYVLTLTRGQRRISREFIY